MESLGWYSALWRSARGPGTNNEGNWVLSMHAKVRIAGWGVLLITGAVCAFLAYRYAMSSALSTDCSNKVLEEVRSPDGAYAAAVFERNCGATNGYYRVVSLRPKDGKFDPEIQDDWIFE